jgi:hypothetical protein
MEGIDDATNEQTKALAILEFAREVLWEVLYLGGMLTFGWLIGSGQLDNVLPYITPQTPMPMKFLAWALWLAVLGGIVGAFIRVVDAQRVNRKTKEQTEDDKQRPRMNHVVLAIAFVFITGLFITLFFGYLIMRNAMLGV